MAVRMYDRVWMVCLCARGVHVCVLTSGASLCACIIRLTSKTCGGFIFVSQNHRSEYVKNETLFVVCCPFIRCMCVYSHNQTTKIVARVCVHLLVLIYAVNAKHMRLSVYGYARMGRLACAFL